MSAPNPLFDLTGRVALITGSSQGLGLAMARGLGAAGATVVLNGRSAEKIRATAVALRAEGLQVAEAAFDVTDSAAVTAGVKQVEAQLGGIDILINNAGIHQRAPLTEMTDAQWRAVLDTNLTSAFFVARAAAPGMIARGAGKIINLCSVMSEVTRPTIANYAASKGGLKMLTRAMAVEWARHGIQANAIAPGYFVTDINRTLVANPEFNAWICKRTPAGRWGQPDELIGAAVFFASRASDYINGQILYIDGGLLAGL